LPKTGPSAGSVAVVDTTYRHGARSLRIEGRADGQNATGQYLTGLQADTEYLLTFFAKTANVEPQAARNAGAAVDIYAAYGWHRHFPNPRLEGTTPWTRMTFRFTTPPKLGERPWMRLTLRNATGAVWYDDVRLRPVKKLDTEGRKN
jgi:hypothetical protein